MMKRFALCLLLGGSVVVSLSRAAMPGWVQLKPAGSSDQAVAFATVQQVADARAKSSWPAAQSGDVIPCVDADGNAIAYVFHYRIDGASFPDYATAASEMTGEQTALDNPRNHSRYAHLFVSARYDRAPILRYGEGGDEFYYTLEPMRARAQGILGEPPTLTRIYYVWPLSFYEFTSGSQVVIIEATPPYRTFSSTEFQQYIRTGTAEAMSKATQSADASTIIASCASQMRAKWNRCLTATDGLDSVYVSDHMLSPFYNWSYGCSPTSGTMVVGYLDAARGLGRCIYDFFQRWDTVTHIIDWQIPHAQREMALDFNTDTSYGGTMAYNIPPGLNTFGSARGYGFDVISDGGNHANDYGWERDSMEISDNYPFVWSVSWQEHSLAAFGFNSQKFIYVHNTWWRPADWWAYTDGSPSSTVEIASVHPPDPDRTNQLLYPRGDTNYNSGGCGETLWGGHTTNVVWTNFGQPGDSVTIDLSTDGGWTWQKIAHDLPDNGSYTWNIDRSIPTTATARLRLEEFAGGDSGCGDGSYGNFLIQTVPLQPNPDSPVNSWPVKNPPVVLVVGSEVQTDSFTFVVDYGGDTIFRGFTTVPRCTVPSGLLLDHQVYGWQCRAHNSFGWSQYSVRWTFRVGFSGVEENPAPTVVSERLAVVPLGREAVDIQYALPEASRAVLAIRDITGRLVRNLNTGSPGAAGTQHVNWDLRNDRGARVADGCYFVTLDLATGRTAGDKLLVGKFEVLR